MRRACWGVVLLAAWGLGAGTALGEPEPTTTVPSGAPSEDILPARPTLEQLRFMKGSWQGSEGDVEMEELWTEPRGGLMLGLHRDVSPKGAFFEFLRIEEDETGVTYWASPGGRAATPFRLVAVERGKATFENASHDFPKRITYWIADDRKLHARVEGTMNGKATSQEWAWERASRAGSVTARERLQRRTR